VLVALYCEGLHRPLHFFPKSAWAYIVKNGSLTRAGETWFSTAFRQYGEDRFATYRLALRGIENPLDAAFERCAHAVFDPLIACIEDVRIAAQVEPVAA